MIGDISGNQIIVWGIKGILILLLFVYLFISFAGFQQARLVNSAVRTKISGLINFLGLLRLLAIVVGIILVLIS